MKTKVLEKPRPLDLENEINNEEIDHYEKLASKIGYQPDKTELQFQRLKTFLAEQGIPVYDEDQVFDWMTDQAKKNRKRWVWRPLRERDVRRDCRYHLVKSVQMTVDWDTFTAGQIEKEPYYKIIPLSVLETAAKVAEGFPEACFFVSDLVSLPKPDPFLAVTLPNCPFLVIDFWNEPGFKPKSND